MLIFKVQFLGINGNRINFEKQNSVNVQNDDYDCNDEQMVDSCVHISP